MTGTDFIRISVGALLAAAICLPSAVSAQTTSLDELRAQKGPEEKIEKLQQKITDLKNELKLTSRRLIPFEYILCDNA